MGELPLMKLVTKDMKKFVIFSSSENSIFTLFSWQNHWWKLSFGNDGNIRKTIDFGRAVLDVVCGYVVELHMFNLW